MYEYVLVIFMTMGNPQYAGNFTSCAAADQYAKDCCKEAEYVSCLHEDYVFLPKGHIKKEVDYGQGK